MEAIIKETLTEFVQSLFSSLGYSYRSFAFAKLEARFSDPEFPESAVKGILKSLVSTLRYYGQDQKSFMLHDHLFTTLCSRWLDTSCAALVSSLGAMVDYYKKSSRICATDSSEAFCALKWINKVLMSGYSNEEFQKEKNLLEIFEAQFVLVYAILASKNKMLIKTCHKELQKLFIKCPDYIKRYKKVLVDVESSQHNFAFVGLFLKYLISVDDLESVAEIRTVFRDRYVEAIVKSREKLSSVVLSSCRGFLMQLTHDDLKLFVLPAIDRSMLRNPEITLPCLKKLVESLSIDLSQYAFDFGKHLATQCISKDETMCSESVECCQLLAKQCTDPSAVKYLVGYFFGILSGSEGKLSVPAQKINIMSAIGKFSQSSVSSSYEEMTSFVVAQFINYLQTEGQEMVAMHGLTMMTTWTNKLTSDVPPQFVQWICKSLTNKSFTSGFRSSLLLCIVSLKVDVLSKMMDCLPTIVQALEKSVGQPFQVQLVSEAVHAMYAALRMLEIDCNLASKYNALWTVVLDTEKKHFVNDKFLNGAPKEALLSLSSAIGLLITVHSGRLNDKHTSMYIQALLLCALRGNHEVQKNVLQKLKRLISSTDGSFYLFSSINELINIVNSDKVCYSSSEECGLKLNNYRLVYEILLVLCGGSQDEEEACKIAREVLVCVHHPHIIQIVRNPWLKLLKKLKIEPKSVIEKSPDFYKMFTSVNLSPSHVNALSTLAHEHPTATFDFLKTEVSRVFAKSDFLNVTMNDYALLSWPEGELFDKSVIEACKPDDKESNMKRENKLYSYKEQLAEMELKKELAKKKPQVKEDAKLTKKQQELMQAQLSKETNVRNNLKQLLSELEDSIKMIEACTDGNPLYGRLSFYWLLPHLLVLFKSPLSAPLVTKLFVRLHRTAFDVEHANFGLLLSQCTLRLSRPACCLDSNWSEESLVNQAGRVIEEFAQITKMAESHFSASTFHYSFYFLHFILKQRLVDEKKLLNCLLLISCHASMTAEDKLDERNPYFLPRKQMLELCLMIIGSTDGPLSDQAKIALLNISESSGAVICEDEVDCLLDALLSSASSVRSAALESLVVLKEVLVTADPESDRTLQLIAKLWISKFDVDEFNMSVATRFENISPPDNKKFMVCLVGYVVSDVDCIRIAASSAVSSALTQHNQHVGSTLEQLLNLYEDKLFIKPVEKDAFGRIIEEASPDNFPARCGVALALGKLAPLFNEGTVKIVFNFFVGKGLVDRNAEVQSEMLNSALLVVNEHGKENLDFLLEVFQEFLKTAPAKAEFDFARQSVVILMGTLAKHLDADHPSLKPIVSKLIDTLSTPSEQVQSAVAECLSPLVVPIKDEAPELIKNLLSLLLESGNYGERRGAAYGLAGLVKGLGILSLKQLDIITVLTDAIQNKKNPRHREGALLAFEMLCQMLGRLFEPYVVHFLPHLLLCFGDNSHNIRKAADETAKVVMSKLSAHGVKLVLPALLAGLEQDSWRTKCGSVELLGAMAHCAPKQLSACLPNIVPKLTEVLTDSHIKVQEAGCQALKQIGSVIRNPEIQTVVPVLLEALQEPTKKTTVALQKLLDTKFIHFIDAPSLALIMPVVERALSERSTETRKIAAQIVGNMYSLTDQKDLAPYLPNLIPGLKQSLLNPMPEVRSASARAFGTMVRGIGEKGIEDLVPWLMQTLTSDTSAVDRSGAAQGLSEVVGGLGLQKLTSLMPDIIQTADRTDIAPCVRDGYIMMYIYLPAVFGDDFIPYVGPIIPSILKALADETEYVRDTALKAGQRIVNQYADTAIELLLPEVEKGLFDDNWRIRLSSILLMGDILFKISGVTGKMTTEGVDDDDNFGTESSQKAILETLGVERYSRVFAGLYLCRQDAAPAVRHQALHVWKVIVTHTPRTLKEIMSTLFHLLLSCLASQSQEKRHVAARTLGDIVKKLGEKVLPEIIPILERGLDSEDADQRQGVCIGLSEIMNSTSRDHVIIFADSLIPTIRKALCDQLAAVRSAAALTFDVLHNNLGPRTLDEILPNLLEKLDDPIQSEYALDGLKQVMAVKSRVVLPYLIPQLTSSPVNTRALCFLSSVAGDALARHLAKILPAITTSLANKLGTEDEAQELQNCKSVILSLQDDAAVRTTMDALIGGAINMELSPSSRIAFLKLLFIFCDQTKVDYSEFIPQLLRSLIHLAVENNEEVINIAWDCLNSIIKKIETSNMVQYISHIRQAIRFSVADLKEVQELPGFSIPKKGIIPLVLILREGVLSGSPEMKESASLGLSEAIRRTSSEALKPSVINITGALIRVLGDRYNANVKVAMLDTLSLLLTKCGINLKPFLPQLQTTFMKALNDITRNVRLKSAIALGKLVSIHNRVDALFAELITQIKSAEDAGIRDTMIYGIRMCLTNQNCKITEKTQKDVTQILETYAASGEDSTRIVAAACLGASCVCLDTDLLNFVLNNNLLDVDTGADWMIKYHKSISLCIALKESPDKLMVLSSDAKDKIKKSLMSYSSADRIPTCLSGLRGIAYFLRHQLLKEMSPDEDLLNLLSKNMRVESNDVKQLVAQLVSFIAHVTPDKDPDMVLLKSLVPTLLIGSKEKNAAVKSFSEHALLSLLRYRKNDSLYQVCLDFLDPLSKSTLSDVVTKVLKKLINKPDLPEDDIDITILK